MNFGFNIENVVASRLHVPDLGKVSRDFWPLIFQVPVVQRVDSTLLWRTLSLEVLLVFIRWIDLSILRTTGLSWPQFYNTQHTLFLHRYYSWVARYVIIF